MYELFVLGELMEKPVHGYLLHQIVQEAIGPIRQLSWGALYPLLRRLEREGLISQEASEGGGGRERKRYRITAAGETRFRALMAEPGAYNADYPDLFTLKLSNFPTIDPAGQLAILEHYRSYVKFIEAYLLASQRHISGEPAISERERPSILRAVDHRLHVAQADLAWLDAEIGRITTHGEGR